MDLSEKNVKIHEIESIANGGEKAPFDLNNYILQNKIGSGSFGKVYKIKEKKTGEIFAAKISRNTIEEESIENLKNLSREIDIISKLNHPSILKFIGFSPVNFKNKNKPVIITEYASNGSLDDLIQLGRNSTINNLNDTRKLIIIYGIASAMSYLHSHEIIHRDLKPGNVLIDEYLLPKIADFGLSKINDDQNGESFTFQSINGSLKGTPIYMSPEIWKKAEYSKACDVYAFAFIVYEIMTFSKPYENHSIYEILLGITNGNRPQFNVSIPSSYRNLIEKCWSDDPIKRPNFDEILNQLKNDRGFITENVVLNDFLRYIEYITAFNVSFNSNKNVPQISKFIRSFNQQPNDKNIKIIEDFSSKFGIFPIKYLLKLKDECKKVVIEAENNPYKQFLVGKNLIEGSFYFPQNAELGLKYLMNSFTNKCIESLIYYIKMLIKGDVIPKNHETVRKLLEKYKKDLKLTYYLLKGKMYKNEKKFSDALKFFEESFNNEDGEAFYEYGRTILKTANSHDDNEKGIQYLLKAIEIQYPKAMYRYGLILIEGKIASKDEEKGMKLIKLAADKEYKKSLYYYSMKLKENRNENYLQYLKKAALQSHVESMYKYGLELSKTNNKDSVLFLKKASDKGHIDSMYQYSLKCQNKKESCRYAKIAADNGNSDAMYYYACCLELGDGVAADKVESLKYFKMAVDKNNTDAMVFSAVKLNRGIGTEVNKNESVKLMKKAVDNGSSEAMAYYASMLENGDGVPVNKEEAVKYYKMAIEKGSSTAMYHYASMLVNGNGVPVNKEEAVKYYKMAIERENSTAMANYAYMLEKGNGVPVNKEEAIKYYKMAIEKGNSIAMNNYANMLEQGNGIPINKEEAIKYYKMAIEKGNSIAMNNYAKC